MATAAITKEFKRLQKLGFDLGSAEGGEQVEAGGRYQKYQHGRIYYSALAGAHGLRGRILESYLQGGGPGPNAAGVSELGFPTSSHERTADGMYDCVNFQRGRIEDVPDTALVRIFGTCYKVWKRLKAELGMLGHPVTNVMDVAGGHIAWFERGMIWHPARKAEALIGELVAPTLGHPAMVDPANPGTFQWLRFSGKISYLTSVRGLADQLVAGRLKLTAVGTPAAILSLEPAGLVRSRGERWLRLAITAPPRSGGRFSRLRDTHGPLNAVRSTTGGEIQGTGGVPPATQLERRRLYNLAVAVPGLAPITVSPHCLYARGDWDTFGIAHITDLHLSVRVEYFRAAMRRANVSPSDLAQFNNTNDRFREFIRYANHLHAAGLLDVIIATGDLVDYVREMHHAADGPGNFAIFEALIRGRFLSPDPDGSPSEELRVPIFTSLGNHDYRGLPYPLAFVPKVQSTDIVADIINNIPLVGGLLEDALYGLEGLVTSVPGVGTALQLVDAWVPAAVAELSGTVWNHKPFNLIQAEALRVIGVKSGSKYYAPALRPKAAARSVLVDSRMARGTHPYFRRVNRDRSYVIKLGSHRIVMFDTRWDDGIGTGVLEAAVAQKLKGFSDEEMVHFFAGSPDSVGILPGELALLRQALREAGRQGTVIVGMHAPPLNLAGSEQPNCMRETVHPTNDPNQVPGYILRRHLSIVRSPRHWPATGTPFFHVGTLEQGLDDGTASGSKDALAQLFAGKGVSRPVNLVVSGHGHYRMEFRLKWNPRRKYLETFMDHYLATPEAFYPTSVIEPDGTTRRYLTKIERGAPPQGTKHDVTDPNDTIWKDLSWISVPPYADPLSESPDEAAWWARHSPVVTQTAALGPCDNSRVSVNENKVKPGPNHQGFRVIQVRDNVIRRVNYVNTDELRRGFPLAWERSGSRPTPPVERSPS